MAIGHGAAAARHVQRSAKVGVAAALAFVLLSVAVPAAQAATYTYANAVSTPEGQARSSGQRASIVGGSAEIRLGLGKVAIVTYYDYPGYDQVGFSETDAGSVARTSHARYSNAFSKCYWRAGGVGGSAALTCTVRS